VFSLAILVAAAVFLLAHPERTRDPQQVPIGDYFVIAIAFGAIVVIWFVAIVAWFV